MSDPRDLEREVARLREELERYRLATDAGLETLDEVIGWLDRNRHVGLARDLRRNRKRILRDLRNE